mmetsp:Transcript_5291/g.10854  ORF Transcript_5291/g.10854 Transcript_5291/m.10854 type:complete len:136 (+) Transcript_5291:627-1034(+)
MIHCLACAFYAEIGDPPKEEYDNGKESFFHIFFHHTVAASSCEFCSSCRKYSELPGRSSLYIRCLTRAHLLSTRPYPVMHPTISDQGNGLETLSSLAKPDSSSWMDSRLVDEASNVERNPFYVTNRSQVHLDACW